METWEYGSRVLCGSDGLKTDRKKITIGFLDNIFLIFRKQIRSLHQIGEPFDKILKLKKTELKGFNFQGQK